MVEIYNGELNVELIINSWYKKYSLKNYGAFITFVGVVRDENGIDGLSFDIYKPLLDTWFHDWQTKVEKQNVILLMAHSIGDVLNHQSSYIAGVVSPKRRAALEIIDEFVEDFKQKAPIWKYDIINGERVYAKDRSYKLPGAGLLK